MNINYKNAYQYLINDIKDKLSKLALNKPIYDKYFDDLTAIELMISSRSSDFEYYEAFLKAYKLNKSLAKLIYHEKDIILPPVQNIEYLTSQRKKLNRDIERLKLKKQVLTSKLCAYILTLSMFATMGAFAITSAKNAPKERLYLTTETTYSDSTGKTRTSSTYEKANNNIDSVTIKKVTPWVTNEKEAIREIYLYHISNMSYGEILSNKDYEKIIENLTFEVKIETMELDTYRGIYQYTEPLYEVIEVTQNQDKYKETKYNLPKETIILLFTELMVYLLAIGVNDGLLMESIFLIARDINSLNDLSKVNKSTLYLLKKQTNELKKKTRKK